MPCSADIDGTDIEGILLAFSAKRPQSFAALDFRLYMAETWSISPLSARRRTHDP
jgi:hypothetical protein